MDERDAWRARDASERLDRLTREGYKAAVDQAFEAQKSGMRLSRRFFENWVETLDDQAELNRNPGLGGKLIVSFQIGGDGIVKSSKISGGSSMRNASVEGCVKSNIMRLKFPAKGGIANVNYPFLFQPGG